ncbi:MAG: TIGR02147 family protein [Halobacteriovoraceae bacterium]|jgi:hypothetical protein|nr:TIGR02147 family protein [Halobacteriovoraceae bacterium]
MNNLTPIASVTFENGNIITINLSPETYEVIITSAADTNFLIKGHPNWLFVTKCVKSPPLWCPMEFIAKTPKSVLFFINNQVVWIHQSLQHHLYQICDDPMIKLSSQNFYFYHHQKDHSALLNYCHRNSGEVETLFFDINGVYLFDTKLSPHNFSAGENPEYEQNNNNVCVYNSGRPDDVEYFDLKCLLVPNNKENESFRSRFLYTCGDIFFYNRLSDFLKYYFEKVKSVRPQWSYQTWARQLGLKSNTSLTKVLNGQRNVGTDLKAALLEYFEFNAKEANYFNLLVNYDRAIAVDPQLAEFLESEIAKRHTGHNSWSNCEFSQRRGLTRRYTKSLDVLDLFMVCGDKSRFTHIYSGHPLEITSNLKKNKIGIDRMDDKIFFYNKQGFLVPIDLAISIINPTDEGIWHSKKWINNDEAALYLYNHQTTERVLYIFHEKYVYTLYPSVDLSLQKKFEFDSEQLIFYVDGKPPPPSLQLSIPLKATNTMYYHDGIKFHFERMNKKKAKELTQPAH